MLLIPLNLLSICLFVLCVPMHTIKTPLLPTIIHTFTQFFMCKGDTAYIHTLEKASCKSVEYVMVHDTHAHTHTYGTYRHLPWRFKVMAENGRWEMERLLLKLWAVGATMHPFPTPLQALLWQQVPQSHGAVGLEIFKPALLSLLEIHVCSWAWES